VITNFQETVQFILFDAKGKQVMQRELEEDTIIDTADLPSGFYMYRVIGGGKMLNGVIVIQ
jgi:hypothetical protein